MSLKVLLGGDVYVTARSEPETALAGLRSVLQSADIRIVNMEGLAVESAGRDGLDIPHKHNWRHPGPEMIDALRGADVDLVSCANNVSYPPAALLESLAALDAAGIGHAGAGPNIDEAHAPCVLEREGIRVGTLAYSSIVFPYGHEATEQTGGIAALRARTAYVPDARSAEVPGRAPFVWTTPIASDLNRMRQDIQQARTRCDFLIVSIHWGLPGSELCRYQPEIARAAIDEGADLVAGHGPHSVHGVDVYGDRPILYSLGNLAFDWPPMRDRHQDGILATCHLSDAGLTRIVIRAASRDHNNEINLAGPADRRILEHITALSPDTAHLLTKTADGLELQIPDKPSPHTPTAPKLEDSSQRQDDSHTDAGSVKSSY